MIEQRQTQSPKGALPVVDVSGPYSFSDLTFLVLLALPIFLVSRYA